MLTTTPRTSVVQPDGGGPGDDDDASSRASSPSKSPLGGRGVSPFLDTQDQPLARQPAGVRAGARVGARASQQGLAGGPRPGLQKPFDAGAADAAAQQEQPRLRSPSQLGRRPALPNWQDMQDAEGLAPDGGDAGVLSGGQAGMPAAPLFGGGHAGAGGGMFGAAPGGFGAAPGGAAAPGSGMFGGGFGGAPFGAAAGSSAGGGGLFGAGAAPSDPVTYQMQAALDKDGVPNMGEVQEEQPGAPHMPSPHAHSPHSPWHIPAVHTTPGSGRQRRGHTVSAGGGKRGLADKPKPGAAFKLGRRQAYTKYLAYEVGAGVACRECLGCAWSVPLTPCPLLSSALARSPRRAADHTAPASCCRAAGSCAWTRCWAAPTPPPPPSCKTAAAR